MIEIQPDPDFEEHDDPKADREPMPSIIWWMLGTTLLVFLVMWSEGGLHRASWWFGLQISFVSAGIIASWFRETLDYDGYAYSFISVAMGLFLIAAACMFLFAVFLAGKVILGPVIETIDPIVHALAWVGIIFGAIWLIIQINRGRSI